MSMIDNFNKDLVDNEAARNAAHAQIDVVHDSIKASIQSGIATFNSFFGATPVSAPAATTAATATGTVAATANGSVAVAATGPVAATANGSVAAVNPPPINSGAGTAVGTQS